MRLRFLSAALGAAALGALSAFPARGGDSVVVFNEIMYNPSAEAGAGGEWIELQNQLAVDLDVSGWRLGGGVEYRFPEGTVIRAGGYLVIAELPALLASRGLEGVLGPWNGRLDNQGETVRLLNNSDRVMDEVDYRPDGEWPVAPDGGGPSLARRGKFRDTQDPASWTASREPGGTPGAENFPESAVPVRTVVSPPGSAWRFHATGGDPGAGWQTVEFDDSAWPSGAGAFHLGAGPLPEPAVEGTGLPSGPVAYYFRRPFAWSGGLESTTLELRLLVNDGAIVHLNGTEVARVGMPQGTPDHETPAAGPAPVPAAFRTVTVPANALVSGGNLLAVELHQAGPSAGYASAVMGSGPVAFWRLDEVSGMAANSAGPPGVLAGSYSGFDAESLGLSGPRPEDALDGDPLLGFEGTNAAPEFRGNAAGGDDVVVVENAGALDFSGTGTFTLEAWVRGPAEQESGAAILARGTGGGGEQYAIDVVGGHYRFFVRSGGGSAVVAQASVGPNGTWQHVAAVFDSAAGIMKLYVNGVEAAAATPPDTLLANSHPVSIGARRSSSQPAWNLNFAGRIDEVAIYSRALTVDEIDAHLAAAVTPGTGETDTSSALFDLELTAVGMVTPGPALPLVLNEVTGSDIEIHNLSDSAVSPDGCVIRRLTSGGAVAIPVPASVLDGRGFVTIPAETAAGDRILLIGPDGKSVLDAAVAATGPRARYPDGTGIWMVPDEPTPASPNRVTLTDAIVINEILYDPPDPALYPPGTVRAGQWIELYNRSSSAVDVSGWQLDGRARFAFPDGTVIPAGGYHLVVADPAAFLAVHAVPPAIVSGPWTGRLRGGGGRIVLRDAVGNPADEVHYRTDGRWPEAANEGGSSLELIDPMADNAAPESWAASDESAKAGWQTFTWRGPNRPSQPGEPTIWRELNLLLVDGPGECLVDDVRVTDLTTNANLIQNGTFDSGADHWRFLGNHRHSSVVPEPGNPGNMVLHLRASGPGEYQGNQIETTFAGNQALVNNREYEISLRARWLSGGARLNTRLYFNRLPRTNLMPLPVAIGTPGRENSRRVPNAGPVWAGLRHSPVIPDPGEPVTVTVEARDPQGIAGVSLHYSVSGGEWHTVPMTSGDGRRFAGVIPGQAGGVVQFYVEGSDTAGAVSRFPAAGPDSRALIPVQDGAATGSLPTVRVVMTPADATFLHTPVNTLSNEYLSCTVIADEAAVHYDAGVRLKGSFVGRNVSRVGFTLRFGSDNLFRGVHDRIAIDRSQHTAIGQGEFVVKSMASRAGGIPNMYDDLARFIHPSPAYRSTCQLRMTAFDSGFLDTQYPDGSDGPMYEFEVHRWNLQTIDGNPESPKRPGNEGGGTGFNNLEITDYGTDREAYRWMMLQNRNRDRDEYDGAIALCRMFARSGSAFDREARERLDTESWLRTLAFQSLTGPADSAYTGSNIHNFRLYIRPHDGRAVYMPWDWDSAFQRPATAPLTGTGNIAKVVTATPDRQRRYLWHLNDLLNRVYNTGYMTRWTQHYGQVAGENFGSILSYIGTRSAYVRARLPGAIAFAASPGTVNGDGVLTLTGDAGIEARFIDINGVLYDPSWTSSARWSLAVPLAPGTNHLVIRATDATGAPLADSMVNVTVENPVSAEWPRLYINEWFTAGGEYDWFEIHNPGSRAADLTGWRLADNSPNVPAFVIPPDWRIPAGGFLLVIADGRTDLNVPQPTPTDNLHVSFQLSSSGDSIALHAPDGSPVDAVAFGPVPENRSAGRLADGGPATGLLTLPTPGAPNVFTEFLTIRPSEAAIEFGISSTPGWTYQLESSPDFLTWSPAAAPVPATGSTLTLTAPVSGARAGFRVRVSR